MLNDPERPPRILVVDDDAVNRELVEAVVAPHGYLVGYAADGAEALRQVTADPPDVVLLDVMMPGLDGFAICRALKADRHTRGIPVVLLTALRESEDRVAGFEAGADDFVSKPFNRYELLARLRSLVRLRRLQEAERVGFRRSLERYLSPPAVEQVLNEPELALVGRRQVATVLFGDLRGFTTLAEAMEPERVVAVLNIYLGKMAEIVFRYDGMVDKFMGDGIMAVFGAPTPAADDPIRAVLAGLEMQAAITALRFPEPQDLSLTLGIGINTGEVVIGNIGSDRRLDYTVVGDAVNLSARLEQVAASGQILVSQASLDYVREVVHTQDLGLLPVRGRQEWVHAHAVLGRR